MCCGFKNRIESKQVLNCISNSEWNGLVVEKCRKSRKILGRSGTNERERKRIWLQGLKELSYREGESEGQSLEIIEVLEHLMDTRIA